MFYLDCSCLNLSLGIFLEFLDSRSIFRAFTQFLDFSGISKKRENLPYRFGPSKRPDPTRSATAGQRRAHLGPHRTAAWAAAALGMRALHAEPGSPAPINRVVNPSPRLAYTAAALQAAAASVAAPGARTEPAASFVGVDFDSDHHGPFPASVSTSTCFPSSSSSNSWSHACPSSPELLAPPPAIRAAAAPCCSFASYPEEEDDTLFRD
jgi:hypothetical protein